MIKPSVNKVVLAYSGGLDTSIIVPWLIKRVTGDTYFCSQIDDDRINEEPPSPLPCEIRHETSALIVVPRIWRHRAPNFARLGVSRDTVRLRTGFVRQRLISSADITRAGADERMALGALVGTRTVFAHARRWSRVSDFRDSFRKVSSSPILCHRNTVPGS